MKQPKMKSVNQVFETNDYGVFKFLNNNRDVGKNNKLSDSIAEKGVLIPVIINENFEVVDGQHRIELAKRHNKPVPFLIVRGINSEDMIQINNTGKAWGITDYIKSFAADGNKEYQELSDIAELNLIPPAMLVSLAMDSTDAYRPKEVAKAGKFKFANYEFFMDFLDEYEALISGFKEKPGSGFAAAYYRLYKLKKFEPARLMSRTGKLQSLIRGINKQGILTELLIQVHNERLSHDSAKFIQSQTESSGNVILFDEIKTEIEKRPAATGR